MAAAVRLGLNTLLLLAHSLSTAVAPHYVGLSTPSVLRLVVWARPSGATSVKRTSNDGSILMPPSAVFPLVRFGDEF